MPFLKLNQDYKTWHMFMLERVLMSTGREEGKFGFDCELKSAERSRRFDLCTQTFRSIILYSYNIICFMLESKMVKNDQD